MRILPCHVLYYYLHSITFSFVLQNETSSAFNYFHQNLIIKFADPKCSLVQDLMISIQNLNLTSNYHNVQSEKIRVIRTAYSSRRYKSPPRKLNHLHCNNSKRITKIHPEKYDTIILITKQHQFLTGMILLPPFQIGGA